MGKRKKEKKKEAREARQQKQSSNKKASNNGNSKGLQKELDKHLKPNSKEKKKPIAKPITSKPEIKITGFYMSSKGNVHAVSKNTIICQSGSSKAKSKNVETNENLSPLDITCKHCLRRKVVKLAIENFSKKKKVVKPAEPETKQEEAKPEQKTLEAETVDIQNDYITIDQARALLDNRMSFLEKRMIKKLESFVLAEIKKLDKPPFFIASKGNNLFAIVHEPSRYVIVDNLTDQECRDLVPKYLEVNTTWDGKGKPSGDWLSAITNVFKEYKKKMKERREEEDSSLPVRRKKKQDTDTLLIRRRGR